MKHDAQIDTAIIVDSKEDADRLEADLAPLSTESSVARQRGRWTVFARYPALNVAKVGLAVARHLDDRDAAPAP